MIEFSRPDRPVYFRDESAHGFTECRYFIYALRITISAADEFISSEIDDEFSCRLYCVHPTS